MTPSASELARADFGFTPDSYQQQIKDHFSQTLFDPYSAHYQFGQPYEASVYKGIFRGGGYYFGHAVDVLVNAKNRFGGYVGNTAHTIFFTSIGELHDVTGNTSLRRINSQFSRY